MVELALILPVLIALLCGIIDFGWIFGNKLLTSYACREGARYGSVIASLPTYSTDIENRVMDVVPSFMHDDMTITTQCTQSSNPRDGDIIVTVQYEFMLLTPVVSTVTGSQNYTAESSCQMKVE
jgi:Flp pilus assembly protein TadG